MSYSRNNIAKTLFQSDFLEASKVKNRHIVCPLLRSATEYMFPGRPSGGPAFHEVLENIKNEHDKLVREVVHHKAQRDESERKRTCTPTVYLENVS